VYQEKLFDEKTRGQKSRDTVPLRMILMCGWFFNSENMYSYCGNQCCGAVGAVAGAASRYGSCSDQMMRLDAAPCGSGSATLVEIQMFAQLRPKSQDPDQIRINNTSKTVDKS
jgi:hypothetical protein